MRYPNHVISSPTPNIIASDTAADWLVSDNDADVLDGGDDDDVMERDAAGTRRAASRVRQRRRSPTSVTCGAGRQRRRRRHRSSDIAVDCERVRIGRLAGPELVLAPRSARANHKASSA